MPPNTLLFAESVKAPHDYETLLSPSLDFPWGGPYARPTD